MIVWLHPDENEYIKYWVPNSVLCVFRNKRFDEYMYISFIFMINTPKMHRDLAKQETLTPPGHLVSPLVCRGPWMSPALLYCWCHSDSASVLRYFTFLSHLFPLPCGAGSTVPREGFDSSVIMPFPGVLWLWHFLYSVGPHPVSSLHIYSLLCCGHSWRVRLTKQETLTSPGHMVSPLVCRGPWMSPVVLFCWCHSDSASVLSYFKLMRMMCCTI